MFCKSGVIVAATPAFFICSFFLWIPCFGLCLATGFLLFKIFLAENNLFFDPDYLSMSIVTLKPVGLPFLQITFLVIF